MARPAAKELTDRELELMHVFWEHGQQTASDARDRLAVRGVDRAYVTVANLVRTLVDKGFLKPVTRRRPFRYEPTRGFNEVSRNLVGELVQRVFRGSREQLLVHILTEEKLTAREKVSVQLLLLVTRRV